jgi:hypothetical protein
MLCFGTASSPRLQEGVAQLHCSLGPMPRLYWSHGPGVAAGRLTRMTFTSQSADQFFHSLTAPPRLQSLLLPQMLRVQRCMLHLRLRCRVQLQHVWPVAAVPLQRSSSSSNRSSRSSSKQGCWQPSIFSCVMHRTTRLSARRFHGWYWLTACVWHGAKLMPLCMQKQQLYCA